LPNSSGMLGGWTHAATSKTGAHEGQTKTATVHIKLALVFLLACAALPARAQNVASDPMAARLSAEKVGGVETGSYSAGDAIAFSLQAYGDNYLLHFAGSPEEFVLHGDRVALGGRVLKYDTGATALRISVWGGMTLYTEEAPSGLPATRTGDVVSFPHAAVSNADLGAALSDEGTHLSYLQKLHLRFWADHAVLAAGDAARVLAFDALTNAEAGIERVIASVAGRQAVSRKIEDVKLVEGDKPGIGLSGRTLLVSFTPSQGTAGRPSSRAVTQALGKLLAVNAPD
jgi:hypothetical protein